MADNKGASGSMSPVGQLGLEITTDEVDDALNFDLDFDAMGDIGDALPNINLDEMGSLGTRSPSPNPSGSSRSSSVVSKGSKRSRADFDSESECDSYRDKASRRMVFQSGPFDTGPADEGPHPGDQASPPKNLRQDREREGRCPDCGLDTHRIVMNENGFELQPLTIEGEVMNGRCLLCNPMETKAPKKGGAMKNNGESKQKGSGQMSPPPPHQQRKMVRGMPAPPSSGNFPPPPPRSGSGSKFSTPTPSQHHSKMALMKQSQLPRKHTAMQHATMAFGNTNNRGEKGTGARPSTSSRRASSEPMGGNGSKPTGGSGTWAQQPDQPHSSNASLSSVSCSDVEGAHHSNSNARNPRDGDDKSQYSQGGLGKAMAMGMGMNCAETASTAGMPQTPAQSGRRSVAQTPQSVPPTMSNAMSSRMAQQTPQSMPPNMNNVMSSRVGGGGGAPATPGQPLPSMSGGGSGQLTGNIPQAVRLAHSKLQSSIYHHHLFPLTDETEQAHAEKTLVYLESGSGDICDIIVAMRRFPFSLPIQRVSCEKLYAHCFDQEHAHAIGLVGGIRTIIDAMEHHPEDVVLQRGCAGVIKHLAGASAYNLEMLDRMGAVAIIVSTMERHPKNASLLESCCWAMEAMSRSTSSEIKMRVAKGGGIHAAMKAVEMYPNNEQLLRAAFHCLRQLGYNPASAGYGHPLQAQMQQQQQRQHGSGSQPPPPPPQQQGQQSPFMSQRSHGSGMPHGGGGGGNMPRGGGGMMMPNNPMMGNMNMGMGNNQSNTNRGR